MDNSYYTSLTELDWYTQAERQTETKEVIKKKYLKIQIKN